MEREVAFTPGPWDATYFTRPDGSEIETVEHVAETTAYSARQCEGATLHGVTLTGEQDGVVVCYTGNGPTSKANANLIAESPDLYELVRESLYHLRLDDGAKAYHERALAALRKARGEVATTGEA